MAVVCYAVIAAHNRQVLLNNLVDVLVKDNVTTVVVDNASNPPIVVRNEVFLLHNDEQPPNLSKLWNMCLDEVLLLHTINHNTEDFVVCVLNDDLEIYSGFIAELVHDLWSKGSAVSSPSGDSGRFTGWCFAMRGSMVQNRQLRFDERLRWWWGDTLLFHQARHLKGGASAFKPKGRINHKHPNEQTVGKIAEQALLDKDIYQQIMGSCGW